MTSISGLSASYLQSLLGTQSTGSVTDTTSSSSSSSSLSSLTSASDDNRLSPFVNVLNTLQNLQQSDPAEYKSVMSKIGENLKEAAAAATTDGDTDAASQLTQLAADFSTASTSGDLPDISDLAQALGGSQNAPPPPPPPPPASSSSDSTTASSSTTSADSTSSTSSADTLSDMLTAQILAAYKANSSQGDSLNPMSIIMSTLSTSGVSL